MVSDEHPERNPEFISSEEKLQCARRELAMRKKVYPRLVMQGRMTKEQAEVETMLMDAIVRDYEESAATERLL